MQIVFGLLNITHLDENARDRAINAELVIPRKKVVSGLRYQAGKNRHSLFGVARRCVLQPCEFLEPPEKLEIHGSTSDVDRLVGDQIRMCNRLVGEAKDLLEKPNRTIEDRDAYGDPDGLRF